MISDTHLDYKSLINDSLLCTDSVHSNSFGVSGEPIADLLSTDSTINLMMLGCLIFFIVALAHSHNVLFHQMSAFFFKPNTDEKRSYPTVEHLLLLSIIALGSLLLSVSTFIIATQSILPHYHIPNRTAVILGIALLIFCFFAVKVAIQFVANAVFFGKRRAIYFFGTQVFITTCTAITLLPITFLQVYSDISVETSLIYLAFVLILNKLVTFYKTWDIFFNQNGLFLQIILYFCTLEIAPLAAAGGIWLSIIKGL